ncbi:MAG: chitobiase/beta-hexosaminidase C-terminal domain-containing protein [Clostridiaceae bacterium]|nr:chitobiase/beta-hexosaminidase C-terminal domain-containing protein [Clostridiaceae bacterium]
MANEIFNLSDKFAAGMAKYFSANSFVKPHSNGKLDFDGVDTVKVYVPQTVEPIPYVREGMQRYGNPKELIPDVFIYHMTQDMAYSGTIDLGNSKSRTIGKATGEWTSAQMEQRIIPMVDRYALNRYAHQAGHAEALASSVTPETALKALDGARRHFVNHRVPLDGRVAFVTPEFNSMICDSKQYTEVEKLAVKAVTKGQVGQCKSFSIIEVPEDLMPAGLNFLAASKRAIVLPEKINELKLHDKPQGISGVLIEGRHLYDAFVIGNYAEGVYACVNNGTTLAAPTFGGTKSATTITCAGGVIKYTLDGSDPRFSKSAKVYTEAFDATNAVKVRAYASAENKFSTDVVEKIW